MERLLFVSGRFIQDDESTSVGDFDYIIPFKPVVTVEDINELKGILRLKLDVENVSITNFRRLELPE